jgi:hypothetical protein
MARKRRLLFSAIAGVAVALGAGMRTALADAGPDPNPGYEIEGKLNYCADSDDPCTTPSTLANLRFAEADVYSFKANDGDSRPQAVAITCTGAHRFDATDHTVHALVMHVFAGPTNFGFDGGWIKGKASVHDAAETSRDAVGRIDLTAHDPQTGDTAEVKGRQVSNNTNNTRVSGGFEIEMHGTLYDESLGGRTPPTPVGTGELECRTGGQPVLIPHGPPPPYFASELGDNPTEDS